MDWIVRSWCVAREKVMSFDCCSSYKQCSDAEKCIHENNPDYKECTYKMNLEKGQIYYKKGENKNMMEFKIVVEAPELVVAVNALVESMKNFSPIPAIVEAPKAANKRTPAAKEKPAEVAPVVIETPVETPVIETPVIEITAEEIRALATELAQKVGNPVIKDIVASCGSKSISGVAVEKRSELMAKLLELKNGNGDDLFA